MNIWPQALAVQWPLSSTCLRLQAVLQVRYTHSYVSQHTHTLSSQPSSQPQFSGADDSDLAAAAEEEEEEDDQYGAAADTYAHYMPSKC